MPYFTVNTYTGVLETVFLYTNGNLVTENWTFTQLLPGSACRQGKTVEDFFCLATSDSAPLSSLSDIRLWVCGSKTVAFNCAVRPFHMPAHTVSVPLCRVWYIQRTQSWDPDRCCQHCRRFWTRPSQTSDCSNNEEVLPEEWRENFHPLRTVVVSLSADSTANQKAKQP